MGKSDSKISKDYYNCSNKSQPHATGFGHITVKGQLVEETLLCVVQEQAHMSKKHQMHMVLFCQDSTLSFSNRKATLYPLEK